MPTTLVQASRGFPLFGAFSDENGRAHIKPVAIVWCQVSDADALAAIMRGLPDEVRISANAVASAANLEMPDDIKKIGGMRHSTAWELPMPWAGCVQHLAPPDLIQEVAKHLVGVGEIAAYLDSSGRNRLLRTKAALDRIVSSMGSDQKGFEFPNVRISKSGSIYVQGFLHRLGFEPWQFEEGQMFFGDLDATMRISDHPYLAHNGSKNDRPPRLDVFAGEGDVPPGMMSVPQAIDTLQERRGCPQRAPGPILVVSREASLSG